MYIGAHLFAGNKVDKIIQTDAGKNPNVYVLNQLRGR